MHPEQDSKYLHTAENCATLNCHGLVGASSAMQAVCAEIDIAARTDAKVLITGETGVGKEAVAKAIHARSRRCTMPFVTVNCAGVPDSLLESEFFGHVRGSFTGAVRDSPGLLRQAHAGTVFLDELGEMSLRLQAMLLRFLETGEIQSVGAGAVHSRTDVRVIAATNRDLPAAVSRREFREDLYYRLNVLYVRIPPLRERKSDIPLLLDHYARLFAEQHDRRVPQLSASARDVLIGYAWPGNVRELRNVVERLVLRVDGAAIDPAHLPLEMTIRGSNPGAPDGAPISSRARVETILEDLLVRRESFWTTAYPMFMMRDITRDDLRFVIEAGLARTLGNYRAMLVLFNMSPNDYKRFMGFLKQHECHLPFQRFRTIGERTPVKASLRSARAWSGEP